MSFMSSLASRAVAAALQLGTDDLLERLVAYAGWGRSTVPGTTSQATAGQGVRSRTCVQQACCAHARRPARCRRATRTRPICAGVAHPRPPCRRSPAPLGKATSQSNLKPQGRLTLRSLLSLGSGTEPPLRQPRNPAPTAQGCLTSADVDGVEAVLQELARGHIAAQAHLWGREAGTGQAEREGWGDQGKCAEQDGPQHMQLSSPPHPPRPCYCQMPAHYRHCTTRT